MLADSPMLTVCPNCATSYGVEMASVRLPKGWACQVRCHRCHCVWKAELSVADKLIVAAHAVALVQRAMAAAQALVGDVIWSPPLQGAPRLALDRIAAGLAGVRTVQVGRPVPAAMQRLVSPGAPLCHLSSPGMRQAVHETAGVCTYLARNFLLSCCSSPTPRLSACAPS